MDKPRYEDEGYRLAQATRGEMEAVRERMLADGRKRDITLTVDFEPKGAAIKPHVPRQRVTWPQPQLAAVLARTAHFGQLDKQGRDYYDHHLMPVALLVNARWPGDPHLLAAAFLHDTGEDTDYTSSTLRVAGVAEEVIEIVEVLTRRPDETYRAYIERVVKHQKARKVEIADNRVNANGLPALAAMGPEQAKDAARLFDRYEDAFTVLLAAEVAG